MNSLLKKISFHLKHLINHPQRFKLACAYFLLATRLNRFVKIRKSHYKIHFSQNVLALNSYIDPKSRLEEEVIMATLLKPGDTYVDVGANIGTLCLSAAKQVENLTILAFEANPKTFDQLKKNLQLNGLGNVFPYQLALGEEERDIIFSDKGSDDQNGIVNGTDRHNKTVIVTMKRLDHVTLLPKIGLLKIDVEGYELFVLEGAIKNLRNCSAIYFEYSPNNTSRYDYHPSEIVTLLESLNFSVHIPELIGDQLILKSFQQGHQGELDLIALHPNHFLRLAS